MTHYRNTGGNSGVAGYEIGDDYIVVAFSGGGTYTYSYRSAGMANVETMKRLATRGSGLNSFINTTVKFNYER